MLNKNGVKDLQSAVNYCFNFKVYFQWKHTFHRL